MIAWVFASDSVLAEMVEGNILKVAEKITEQDIARTEPKLHCVRLAVDALKKSAASCKELQESRSDCKCDFRARPCNK